MIKFENCLKMEKVQTSKKFKTKRSSDFKKRSKQTVKREEKGRRPLEVRKKTPKITLLLMGMAAWPSISPSRRPRPLRPH
jgi:hypothetical protein